jgi:hypothetical protein
MPDLVSLTRCVLCSCDYFEYTILNVRAHRRSRLGRSLSRSTARSPLSSRHGFTTRFVCCDSCAFVSRSFRNHSLVAAILSWTMSLWHSSMHSCPRLQRSVPRIYSGSLTRLFSSRKPIVGSRARIPRNTLLIVALLCIRLAWLLPGKRCPLPGGCRHLRSPQRRRNQGLLRDLHVRPAPMITET